MKKFMFFLIQLMVISSLFLWFYLNPGSIEINWLDYQAQMSISVFLSLILCGACLMLFTLRLLMWILRIPRRWSGKYRLHRLRQAQQNLRDVLTKYNNKDYESIQKSLKIVLEEEETQFIGHYFAVEIAKAQHDVFAQEHHLQKIIQTPGAQALGYTKLVQLKMMQNEPNELLRCAKLALPFAQEAPELAKFVFYIYLDHHLITEAEDLFNHLKRKRMISSQSQSILESDFLSIHVKMAIDAKDTPFALEKAKKAYTLHPTYEKLKVYIDLLLSQDALKQIRKILERVWSEHPDPRLISLYQETQKDALPSLKFQGIETLTQGNPLHPESLLAKAQAALEAQFWGLALDHLQDYERKYPLTDRFLRLRAKYAQLACHDQEAALNWLEKRINLIDS